MTKTATTTAKVPTEVGTKTYTRESDKSKLPTLLADVELAKTKLNGVVNGDDVKAIAQATEGLNKALEAYNAHKTLCDYEDMLEKADPMKVALQTGYITLKKAVAKTERALNITTYEIEDTDSQIDFCAFSTRGGNLMHGSTATDASQMGYMTLVAKAAGDGSDVSAVTTAYQSARGKVVTEVYTEAPSTNKMKEALQKLINDIYFEDNGKGLNRFMVTTEWLHWFNDAISKTTYTKGNLGRSVKQPKLIIQTACALYHAFYNKYGITTVIDREHVVVQAIDDGEPKTKAKKATTKKTAKKVAAK